MELDFEEFGVSDLGFEGYYVNYNFWSLNFFVFFKI